MTLVFISGPYRGPYHDRIQNIRKAQEAAVKLARAGFYFICPHTHTGFMDDLVSRRPRMDETFWLNMYVHLLTKCDAMLQLPGWKKSEGCQREYSAAIGERIPIFQTIKGLKEWANIAV